MANDVQILDKIQRNLEQAGIAVVRAGSKLEAGNIKVQYQAADIQAPMGGIDDSINPFLGVGIANPGKIVVSGLLDADTTIASIFVDATDLRIMRVVSGHANNILVKAGRTDDSILAASLAELEGHVDMLGMGQ